MKSILPYEKLTLLSKLPPEEVASRLRKNMSDGRFKKEYIGELRGNRFSMRRNISYRNSFLPMITGFIFSDPHGTKITVDMRLHTAVLVFVLIWLAITGVMGVAGIVWAIRHSGTSDLSIELFVPLLMFLGVALMTILAFKFESYDSKKFLRGLFEAEEVK